MSLNYGSEAQRLRRAVSETDMLQRALLTPWDELEEMGTWPQCPRQTLVELVWLWTDAADGTLISDKLVADYKG